MATDTQSGNFQQPARRNSAAAVFIRATPFFIFTFLLSLYLYTLQGIPLNGDPETMYLVASSIATRGSVALPPNPDLPLQRGTHGAYYAKFGIGQSLVEAPFVTVFRSSNRVAADTIYIYYLGFLAAAAVVPLLSACSALLLFCIVSTLGGGRRSAIACSLIYGCASLAWPMSKYGFSEPLQTFLVLSSFLAALKCAGARSSFKQFALAAASGFFAGFLVATKFVMIIFAPIVLIFIISAAGKSEVRRSARLIIPFMITCLFWLCVALFYNHVRFGSFFDFGYVAGNDNEFAFTTPLLSGLYGLLLSPGKSIFLYTPALIPALMYARSFHARYPRVSALVWTFTIATVLLYSKWWAWHGDDCWGPRFILPCIPFALLPLSLHFCPHRKPGKARTIFVSSLLVLSMLVQLPAVLVNFNEFIKTATHDVQYGIFFTPGRPGLRDSGLAMHFVPEFSPVAGQTWMLAEKLKSLDQPAPVSPRYSNDFPWNDLTRYAKVRTSASALPFDFWHMYLPREDFFPQSKTWAETAAKAVALFAVASLICLLLSIICREPAQ